LAPEAIGVTYELWLSFAASSLGALKVCSTSVASVALRSSVLCTAGEVPEAESSSATCTVAYLGAVAMSPALLAGVLASGGGAGSGSLVVVIGSQWYWTVHSRPPPCISKQLHA